MKPLTVKILPKRQKKISKCANAKLQTMAQANLSPAWHHYAVKKTAAQQAMAKATLTKVLPQFREGNQIKMTSLKNQNIKHFSKQLAAVQKKIAEKISLSEKKEKIQMTIAQMNGDIKLLK